MALTVISRPAKDIDGVTSTWNAVNLPIQYKLNSDLFPTNSVDSNEVITSFDNNGGFLQVTATNPITNVLEGEYVRISGADVDSYNTQWKVKEVVSTTIFVLYASYDSNLTAGNIQKYYNNYFAEVKVYAGLPTYHADYLTNPIVEVGTLRVIPNIDNDIIASFSGIVKADIVFNNQLSDGIELDSFTGFYIQWREGWDESASGIVETVYTSFEIDEVSGCGVDLITNGDFATDLSGWTQQDATIPSQAFVWNAGLAESNLNTLRKTKVIYQEANLVANIEYSLSLEVTRSNSKASNFVVYGSNDLLDFFILHSDSSNGNVSVSETIVPNSDFKYIGFHFYRTSGQGPVNTTLTIDDIVVIPTVCEFLFWGSNSALQFQGSRGGNMHDYVVGRPDSKFMTKFEVPTIFNGEYYDISFINEETTSLEDFDNDVLVRLRAKDVDQANGTPVTTWFDTSGNGEDFIADVGREPTFNTSGGVNNQPMLDFDGSDWMDNLNISIAQPVIVYWVGKMNAVGGGQVVIGGVDMDNRFVLGNSFGDMAWVANAGNTVVLESSPDFVNGNVGKFIYNGTDFRGFIDNVDQTNPLSKDIGENDLEKLRLGNVADGLLSDPYLGNMSEIIIVSANVDPCVLISIEKYLSNEYATYDYEDKVAVINQYSNGAIIETNNDSLLNNSTGIYRLSLDSINAFADSLDVTIYQSGVCAVTETKNININNECSNQEIYLTWLNTLGGWDYWKFTAEKSHNLNIESKETIKRNVFADWDNTFINGDTSNDVIGVTAFKEIDVFSQYLTLEEVQSISSIKYSLKVQVIDNGIQTTVIVDSDSITVFNDGDDETLHTIRFKIQMPDIQTQSQ